MALHAARDEDRSDLLLEELRFRSLRASRLSSSENLLRGCKPGEQDEEQAGRSGGHTPARSGPAALAPTTLAG
jgi:hypothetical protein